MLGTRDILLGVLLPLLLAAGLRATVRKGAGDALFLAAGFVAGYVGLRWDALAVRPFPPLNAFDWLPYLAAAVGIGASIVGAARRPLVRLIVLSALAGAAVLVLLSPLRVDPSLLAASACAAVVFAIALEPLARRSDDPSLALAVGLTCAAAAMTLMLSDSQTFGQIGGLLTVSLLGGFVAGGVRGRWTLSASAGGFVGVMLPLVLIAGWRLAGLTPVNGAVLLAAPLLVWVTRLPKLRDLRPWKRVVIGVTLTAIPLILVVAKAGLAFARANASGGAGGAGERY